MPAPQRREQIAKGFDIRHSGSITADDSLMYLIRDQTHERRARTTIVTDDITLTEPRSSSRRDDQAPRLVDTADRHADPAREQESDGSAIRRPTRRRRRQIAMEAGPRRHQEEGQPAPGPATRPRLEFGRDSTPVDPWTAFLEWLQTILVPDWTGLINLLPILLIVGVIGPGLTLLAVYWIYVAATNRRGKVRWDEPTPVARAARRRTERRYSRPTSPTARLTA